jgi:predicted PurR-regulated permease PerM
VSLYLVFAAGEVFAGLGLLIWGIAVVSTVDNILRPLFISQAIRMSLLLIFVGVVGGIFAFGLIGLFIGPIVMAIGQVTWEKLVAESGVVTTGDVGLHPTLKTSN